MRSQRNEYFATETGRDDINRPFVMFEEAIASSTLPRRCSISLRERRLTASRGRNTSLLEVGGSGQNSALLGHTDLYKKPYRPPAFKSRSRSLQSAQSKNFVSTLQFESSRQEEVVQVYAQIVEKVSADLQDAENNYFCPIHPSTYAIPVPSSTNLDFGHHACTKP